MTTNYNFFTQKLSSEPQNSTKPKTITIDARCKEVYYHKSSYTPKEAPETAHQRHVFWNYMMNVSMQNTIVQMARAN